MQTFVIQLIFLGSKYFGTNKGVSVVSLNANHVAINARVFGANEHESHFIFDLLMNNSTEIVPDVLSTDTHGVNHVNFTLLDLFSYRFVTRYAQVGKVINELFDVKEDKTNGSTLTTQTHQYAADRGALGYDPAYHCLASATSNRSGNIGA